MDLDQSWAPPTLPSAAVTDHRPWPMKKDTAAGDFLAPSPSSVSPPLSYQPWFLGGGTPPAGSPSPGGSSSSSSEIVGLFGSSPSSSSSCGLPSLAGAPLPSSTSSAVAGLLGQFGSSSSGDDSGLAHHGFQSQALMKPIQFVNTPGAQQYFKVEETPELSGLPPALPRPPPGGRLPPFTDNMDLSSFAQIPLLREPHAIPQLFNPELAHTLTAPKKKRKRSTKKRKGRALKMESKEEAEKRGCKVYDIEKSGLVLTEFDANLKKAPGNASYRCPEDDCGQVFTPKNLLRRHWIRFHLKIRSFVCTDCGASFFEKYCLNRHVKIHKQDKKYQCELCNKRFIQRSHLNVHKLIHTQRDSWKFECPICGKKSMDKSGHKRHLSHHSDTRKFECPLCKKRFRERFKMKQHWLIHTGQKPHKCTTCGKGFRSKNLLTKHNKSHTGEKPHVCTRCSKCFKTTSGLKRHMLTHDGAKPYACKNCGEGFNRQNNKMRHETLCKGPEDKAIPMIEALPCVNPQLLPGIAHLGMASPLSVLNSLTNPHNGPNRILSGGVAAAGITPFGRLGVPPVLPEWPSNVLPPAIPLSDARATQPFGPL